MAISIPRDLVEQILLGPVDNRRQLQDSPILSDVWTAFAEKPDQAHELLITPDRKVPAGRVAFAIHESLDRAPGDRADIAPLHGVVAARLYFEEVLRLVLPLTEWWNSPRVRAQFESLNTEQTVAERLNEAIDRIVDLGENAKATARPGKPVDMLPAFDRLIALAGLILWARDQKVDPGAANPLAEALNATSTGEIFNGLYDLFQTINAVQLKRASAKKDNEAFVKLISLNRTATPAVTKSVPAVKADAARTLFHIDCSEIAWAVIDSGIQGDHPAFRHPIKQDESRVVASFDFRDIRKIVSFDNLALLAPDASDRKAKDDLLEVLLHKDLRKKPSRATATKLLRDLADGAKKGHAIDWELVRPFVEIKPDTRPAASDHGTHVAGILGARKADAPAANLDDADGMCPDIQLYDFRVLAPNLKETEFAIIAALQFIRHLNARFDFMPIQGANLSLSIPHDVRNYGCGRTPVCQECERLVESGVVVVAAAGNLGYQNFTTKEGSFENYAAFSITDPGNADSVITVGATHRYSPHTYGVSFFSSRGPTGDGRLKPDLVAPGERIRAPFRVDWDDLDGTSMAAPHVSGAAAMLMARYPELIREPRRIKRILCESATDLGRERSFQGHGMLDVLRALQSI